MSRCPGCEIQHSDDPFACFAIGVALGRGYASDIHEITEMMCPTHRKAYMMAALRVAAGPEASPGQGDTE